MTLFRNKLCVSIFFILLLHSFGISQTTSNSCSPPGGDDQGCQGCGGGKGGNKGGLPINITTLHAVDPNDIQGPLGYTAKQWMSVNDRLGFTVRYENDPDFANGPAQKVIISVPIDPKFDINSVRIGNFGFGNLFFTVPPNSPTYYARLDLRDSLGLYVDVLAGINVTENEAIWVFQSIDPATNAEPLDPNVGFLPVRDTAIDRFNDSIPQKGEGFVTFSIKPKTTVNTGDTARAKANIIFDDNAPVITNTWFNTLDAKPPQSQLDTLPAVAPPFFTISWQATDDTLGSGVKNYELYVSKNTGPFELLQANSDSTRYSFVGEPGVKYGFAVRATDRTGNKEPLKQTAEQTVTIAQPNTTICPGANVSFSVPSYGLGYTYQWQVDSSGTGASFNNISGTSIYTGTNGNMLNLTAPPTSYYGYQYRCVISSGGSPIITAGQILKFSIIWRGTANTAWENPANWSCGVIPDGFTDVIIPTGSNPLPVINSNAACRSLMLKPGTSLIVVSGYKLEIKGK